MAIKKSDLYSSLWASCDELRGGMDASQYKDYVLFMLFIKYITDKYGNSDDFEPPVSIPKGASFKDMIALKGKSDIGEKINTQIIQPLIESNQKLARSDFPDFNDPNKLGEGQAMVDRLTNLIGIFQKPELDFSQNRAEHDDILGDAYEYLMRHFATESGKSKGQFYTPAEVSRVMAKVIGISPANSTASTTAYDPTCGSGSLLLKVAAEAGKPITLEGQEKDVTTAGLARMNTILHNFPTASIVNGNTLAAPKFKDGEQLRTYDYVVANPPFSDKTWSTGLTLGDSGKGDPYQRFSWGVPPAKQGDYAYLLHIIRSMKAAGKAACILPHGVLFRGNAEAVIRQQLVRSGILKAIIGLPANLFYGTSIPACILVLDKENATARKGIFMIDASKGFTKDGNKNRLREQDIHKIVDTFNRQADIPRYARMVPYDEIASPKNDYNLNLPRYIDSSEPEDLQDIDAHLNGGIPERDIDAFAADWQQMPGLRAALFESAGRPGYARLKLQMSDVRSAILGHSEFTAFIGKVTTLFGKWREAITPKLMGFSQNGHPKELIGTVSETLLASMQAAPLIDAYAVYQDLMDYWAETMQDDAYLITADGWIAKPARIIETDKKGKKKDRGWACDLIPKPYIVARYFAKEQAALDAAQAERETISSQITELEEEHSAEDGAFAGFDKINAAQIKDRVREIGTDPDAKEELAVLKQWLKLSEQESQLKKSIKELDAKLDQQAHDHYAKLSVTDIKSLVINDKWLARLAADLQGEIDRVGQTLNSRIRELAERYAAPLPQLVKDVSLLSAKVDEHLKRMSMQLLAGQTRLPGFSGAWEVKTLGDLGSTYGGLTGKTKTDFGVGAARYVTFMNVMTNVVIDCEAFDQVQVSSNESQNPVLQGDLLFNGSSETPEEVALCSYMPKEVPDLFLNSFCFGFRLRDKLQADGLFLSYYIRATPGRELMKSLAQGSTRYNISKGALLRASLLLPPKDEQIAIAAVLSDMDTELAALEARLVKTRALKQAMLQKLLTGKTRQI